MTLNYRISILLLFISISLYPQQWVPSGLRTAAMKTAGMGGGDGGQYETSLDRSRSNPNVIFTCFDVGHVEKSSDGGKSWNYMLQYGLKAGGMCSVIIHPSDTNSVFGYGNYINYKTDSESGVFKTTDGGTNWTKVLGLTNTYYSAADVSSGVGGHHQIEIDWSTPSKIYFGSYKQGFYKSTDGGSTWTKTSNSTLDSKAIRVVRIDPNNHARILVGTDEGELWVSTDSGETLAQVLNPGFTAGIVGNIVFHPSLNSVVFVSIKDAGAFKSTNGGASSGSYYFMPGSNKSGAILFDISPTAKGDTTDYMYLMCYDKSSIQAYYSHNNGVSWTGGAINTSATFHGSASTWIGGVTNISCDPSNKNIAIATIGTRVYKTTDGGALWEPTNSGHNGFAHGRGAHPGIFFDPVNPTKMWTFNYDFGTVYTSNYWDTAERLTGMSLPSPSWGSHQVGGIVLPSGRIFAIGGTYYNHIICKKDPGAAWQALTTSYTYTTTASSINVSAADYCETIQLHSNGTTIYVNNIRSDNSGDTWALMADGTYHILGMYQKNCDVIYAAKYSASSDRTNTQVIYKSSNKGSSWTALPIAPVKVGYTWTSICYFAVDPSREDRFYTVSPTDVNSIYRYDAGVWTKLTVVAGKETKSIAIDPNSSNIIYCSLGSKGEPFIYKSENYGNSWTSIQKNHPMEGTAYLAVNPHDGSLFSGSELGMWRLANNNWPLKVFSKNSNYNFLIRCYPNPFYNQSLIKYNVPVSSHVHLEIFNSVGQKIKTLINEVKAEGQYEIVWDGNDGSGQAVPEGIYFCKMSAGRYLEVVKMLVIR